MVLILVLIILIVLFGGLAVAVSPLLWILVVIFAAVILYNTVRR